MRRPKSKKIRGGVTVRAQDLTRLPSDVFGEIREMHPLLTSKFNNITLRHAVKDYVSNSRAKMYLVRKHGDISQWDVSSDEYVLFVCERTLLQPAARQMGRV